MTIKNYASSYSESFIVQGSEDLLESHRRNGVINHIEITVQDDKKISVMAKGPIVKKDGEFGAVTLYWSWYARPVGNHTILFGHKAMPPQWVVTLARDVLSHAPKRLQFDMGVLS